MAHGHFNTSGSPYRIDPKTAFYRAQDEERRVTELTERTAQWLAGKLSGHSYDSLDALQRAATEVVEDWEMGELDDTMAKIVRSACVLLWVGRVDRDSRYCRCDELDARGITFNRVA